jgi:insertion element IS1 protein InsB
VERDTRRILAYGVVYERDWRSLQQLVIDAPPAHAYFSDGFATYAQLMYPTGSTYTQMQSKSQTYSVEGDNAELRHYLARLGRKSRCFSRCLWALERAVGLFVYAWNRRQEFKRQYPSLPAHVMNFVADL